MAVQACPPRDGYGVSYSPGSTIGNYRIEDLIGSGGIGQVFRATHLDLDRRAAVKIMHMQYAGDPTFQARFKREARAAGSLHHPNIVEIIDSGQDQGRFYLVMELVPDGSLRLLLRERTASGSPLPLPEGIGLVLQAARGLAYAHERGMVHRDVKPDNLLILRERNDAGDERAVTVKLSDFGLVRLGEEGLATAQGVTMGTPAYMSPEQCQGLDLDARTDIYSLGVVLYEVTTGYLPFHTASLTDAVYKHVYTDPPPPRSVKADLPEALETIILRCLRKAPAERYLTTQGLIDDLEQLVPRIAPVAPAPPPAGVVTIQQRAATLGLKVAEPRYTIMPGVPAMITVTLTNRGAVETAVDFAVDGVPADWLQLPQQAVRVAPESTATQVIGVAIPTQPVPRAGEFLVTIAARGTHDPAERQTALTTLVVQPAPVSRGPFPSETTAPAGKTRPKLPLVPVMIAIAGLLMVLGSLVNWVDWGDGDGVNARDVAGYLGGEQILGGLDWDGSTTLLCGLVVLAFGVVRVFLPGMIGRVLGIVALAAALFGLGMAIYGWRRLVDEGYPLAWGVQLVLISAGAGLLLVLINLLRPAKQ